MNDADHTIAWRPAPHVSGVAGTSRPIIGHASGEPDGRISDTVRPAGQSSRRCAEYSRLCQWPAACVPAGAWRCPQPSVLNEHPIDVAIRRAPHCISSSRHASSRSWNPEKASAIQSAAIWPPKYATPTSVSCSAASTVLAPRDSRATHADGTKRWRCRVESAASARAATPRPRPFGLGADRPTSRRFLLDCG